MISKSGLRAQLEILRDMEDTVMGDQSKHINFIVDKYIIKHGVDTWITEYLQDRNI